MEANNGSRRARWQKFAMAILGLVCLTGGLAISANYPGSEGIFYSFCGAVVPLVGTYIWGNVKEHEAAAKLIQSALPGPKA